MDMHCFSSVYSLMVYQGTVILVGSMLAIDALHLCVVVASLSHHVFNLVKFNSTFSRALIFLQLPFPLCHTLAYLALCCFSLLSSLCCPLFSSLLFSSLLLLLVLFEKNFCSMPGSNWRPLAHKTNAHTTELMELFRSLESILSEFCRVKQERINRDFPACCFCSRLPAHILPCHAICPAAYTEL